MFRLVVWSENKNKTKIYLNLNVDLNLKSVPQSYIYGSPYLGAAAATQNPAASAGLAMQMPAATQLSHAAALAAATSQFYEYQVSSFFRVLLIYLFFFGFILDFLFFLILFYLSRIYSRKCPWIIVTHQNGNRSELHPSTNLILCSSFSLQNALAATAAPFPGQYSGFEAYPYAAATGKAKSCSALKLQLTISLFFQLELGPVLATWHLMERMQRFHSKVLSTGWQTCLTKTLPPMRACRKPDFNNGNWGVDTTTDHFFLHRKIFFSLGWHATSLQ